MFYCPDCGEKAAETRGESCGECVDFQAAETAERTHWESIASHSEIEYGEDSWIDAAYEDRFSGYVDGWD
jgi:hypothetical protein